MSRESVAEDFAGGPGEVAARPRLQVRWNLPNVLTLCRVALVPVLVLLLVVAPRTPGRDGWLLYSTVLVLTLVAGVTDAVDGHLARVRQQVTRFGRLTDPVADKLLSTAVLVLLVEKGAVPGWMVVVMLSREFAVMTLRMLLSAEGIAVPVSRWAKIKTIFQVVAMVTVLIDLSLRELAGGGWVSLPVSLVVYFWMIGQASLWVALALTLVTGVAYFRQNWAHLEGGGGDRGSRSGSEGAEHAR